MPIALPHHVYTTLDRVIAELSEPDQWCDWCAVELDVIEVVEVDDVDPFNEPTMVRPRVRKNPFAEPTVPLDMPYLRAQLW